MNSNGKEFIYAFGDRIQCENGVMKYKSIFNLNARVLTTKEVRNGI